MSAIYDWLYLGCRKDAKSLEFLEKHGITHVLNVTPSKVDDPAGIPNYFESSKRFTYRRCPVLDNKAQELLAYLPGCIEFIRQARHYGKVLVHCRQGISRSVSVVIAFMMHTEECTYQVALNRVQQIRPQAQPNAAFQDQLLLFQAQVLARKASTRSGPTIGPAMPPPSRANDSKRDEGSQAAPPPPQVLAKCEECSEKVADVWCPDCDVKYCKDCCSEAHALPDIGDHSSKFEALSALGTMVDKDALATTSVVAATKRAVEQVDTVDDHPSENPPKRICIPESREVQ